MASRTEAATPPKKIVRLNRNSKILNVILEAIRDKKGEKLVSLDLRKIPEAVADFFVVCEASSTVQVKAIADRVEEAVKKECGELPYKHEGHGASQWILVDFVNVVVHVFLSETRKFYRLEEMWGDGLSDEDEVEEPKSSKSVVNRKKKVSKK